MWNQSIKTDFEIKGFKLIGKIHQVEYLAKINEDRELIYVTMYNDKSTGNPRSLSVDEIELFYNALKMLKEIK